MSSTEKVTYPTTKKSEITPPDASCGDCNALEQGGTSEVGLQPAENITEGTEGSDWAGLVREYEENNARCRELRRAWTISPLSLRKVSDKSRRTSTMPPTDRIVKLSEQIFEECKSVSAFIAEIGPKIPNHCDRCRNFLRTKRHSQIIPKRNVGIRSIRNR